ncbi:MAP3K12-binding inhibitory protein 1 isoform X2 [Rhinatrema bivittatum]|uniref:MAP3K12-binding inhibitory protein 1 isoform X2 n=1 Tax=Rhinatrema bivittatum TaxID=194408 RepID=UPI001128BA52|nr:MAP3K12-binding inhibitory protein 1 isoform X2 [Rhinatrema bivittatum]
MAAERGNESPAEVKCVVSGILRALQDCAGQLNLGDVVQIAIDWSKLQSLSALQPALLCSALQQHILHLQSFLDQLQMLIKAENAAPVENVKEQEMGQKDNKNEKPSDDIGGELTVEETCTSSDSGNSKERDVNFDPEVVQIKAKKAEIDRRISAFIERKQAEINENNVREFCNVIDCNQENSCARTDAVFTPYPGFKSHVKVSRVVNMYGPQTRSEAAQDSSSKAPTLLRDCGNQAIEERLQNIEAHLRLQTGGPVPKDIYQRIKKLEDRILELEGLSPEYFQTLNFSSKRRKTDTPQSYSLLEIDEKINALKQTLLRKASGSGSMKDKTPTGLNRPEGNSAYPADAAPSALGHRCQRHREGTG